MSIKVKDILGLKIFKDSELIAGENGVEKIVKSASLMEVPDIYPYLEAHNILLTTLFPIHQNENAQKELLPKLNKKEISAICIKPGRYVESIPEIMIEQAESLNLPLIRLGDNANLSTMANKILELSLDKHLSTLEFRNNIHEKLMDLFLKGKSLDFLVNSLAEMIKNPVILSDTDFKTISISKDLKDKNIEFIFPNNDRTIFNKKLKLQIDDHIIYKENLITHPIKAGNQCFGYLLTQKGYLDPENLQLAIEQASLLIASVFYKNNAVLEKEKNFQDAFIRNILQGKIKSQIEAIEKARAFGWELEFPQIMMIIKIFTEDEVKKKKYYEKILNNDQIEKVFNQSLSIYQDKIKTIYINDSLVVFINAIFDKRIQKNLKDVGEKIIDKIDVNSKVGVGISQVIKSIDRFPAAYKITEKNLDIARILEQNSFVMKYDEYEIFNLIDKISDFELLNSFLDKKLGKLIRHERESEMNLIETLRVLIDNNFNLKKSAKAMYLHYNTMRYRVEKLKDYGINIEDGYQLAEIVFAYNIHLWLKANDQLRL
ncbi:PucR family transcriptional regulator [Halanaerobium sp. ST460_2HS_T2]|uniref:PucR family transcriptional regulator n=1 Tax=Halanaerobium sp. ST460_2HS_T2 TaxID=2183914 RepID=UPI000DFBA6CA|nr:PucR family transcriptional regulator [Halanaerobium sp. ST460_2HS_T2]RCW62480.1 CdaR family transcriptional regulator [Halanaerobium sp. ST460_2HS_T2]